MEYNYYFVNCFINISNLCSEVGINTVSECEVLLISLRYRDESNMVTMTFLYRWKIVEALLNFYLLKSIIAHALHKSFNLEYKVKLL